MDASALILENWPSKALRWIAGFTACLLPLIAQAQQPDPAKAATGLTWVTREVNARPQRSLGGPGLQATPQWTTRAVEGPGVRQELFESKAAKTKVSFFVYTPPAYRTEEDRRFPVLYWLHGSGGGLPGVPVLARLFDTAIRDKRIPPMIVVFPNGLANGMWCDSKDGSTPLETIVIKELIPHIDATMRTSARREGRMIEGFSMGGYGAARLGFKYPELFCAISILGAGPMQREFKYDEAPRFRGDPAGVKRMFEAVYGGDQGYYLAQSPWALAESAAPKLTASRTLVRVTIGSRDETLANNGKFVARLAELKVPHTFEVVRDIPHNAKLLLEALGDKNWEFYRAAFGAVAVKS